MPTEFQHPWGRPWLSCRWNPGSSCSASPCWWSAGRRIPPARWLLAEQLLDELSQFLLPVVVGTGARLFDDVAVRRPGLRLDECAALRSGALALRYGTATG